MLSSETAERTAPQDRIRARDFLLARLGSLFAFLPVGAWVTVHLWHQLAAYESPDPANTNEERLNLGKCFFRI